VELGIKIVVSGWKAMEFVNARFLTDRKLPELRIDTAMLMLARGRAWNASSGMVSMLSTT
jgi:hypothetical protein